MKESVILVYMACDRLQALGVTNIGINHSCDDNQKTAGKGNVKSDGLNSNKQTALPSRAQI